MRFLKLDKHTDARKATHSSEPPAPLEPAHIASKVMEDALPFRPSTVLQSDVPPAPGETSSGAQTEGAGDDEPGF